MEIIKMLNGKTAIVPYDKKNKYSRVLYALKKVRQNLKDIWNNLDYQDLKYPEEYDIKKCTFNLVINYNEELYISMNKTCHALQYIACHFIEREHYESAITNLWQSFIERKFKNIIYRYGIEFYGKSSEGDSIENHEKYERLVLTMIRYMISYIKDKESLLHFNNLEWVKDNAMQILIKEGNGPGRFKAPKKKKIKQNLHKTKLCENYIRKGYCEYGDKCHFAHGENDIKLIDNNYVKTKLCKYYEKYGKCPHGKKCIYAHGTKELKYMHNRYIAKFNNLIDVIKVQFKNKLGGNFNDNIDTLCNVY
jgi:hypothetical protein